MTLSARFERAQEDPIWFVGRRLNLSSMTAWQRFYFYLSVIVCWTAVWVLGNYHCLGASDRSICWVVWTEYLQSQQDSNLSRKNPSEFWSNALSTPPWLHNRFSKYIGVGHSILNCCFTLFLFLEKVKNFSFFGTFWRFDVVLNNGDWIVPQSARFERAQSDPIWFRVRSLHHSPITPWGSSYFSLSGSFLVELLCELILSQGIT